MASRKSAVRRNHRRIVQAAKHLSTRSLLAAVEATSVTPDWFRHTSDLALIFNAVVNAAETGTKRADSGDMARLLAIAKRQDKRPGVEQRDYAAVLRPAVVVPWRNATHRFLPGVAEAAAVQVELFEELSFVIDPALIDYCGFGLGDVGEVLLRRMDYVVSELSNAWPDEQQPDIPITNGEIEAALALSDFSDLIGDCLYPDQARQALETCTLPSDVLVDPRGDSNMPLPALVVSTGFSDHVPVPAGFLLGVLYDLTEVMSTMAARVGPDDLAAQLEFELGKKIHAEMLDLGHPMEGVIKLETEEQFVHLVVDYEDRGLLFLDIAATLEASRLGERAALGTKNMQAISKGAPVDTTFDASVHIGKDLMCVQVLFSPGQNMDAPHSDFEMVALPEFIELVRSLDTPHDLWDFLRDKRGNGQYGSAWSLMANWGIWKDHGNRFPVLMEETNTPGVPGREIADRPESTRIKRSLAVFGLDLPKLSTWPSVTIDRDIVCMSDPDTRTNVILLAWDTPVAIDASYSLATQGPEGFTLELGIWIAGRLLWLKDAVAKAMSESGMPSMHIKLIRSNKTNVPPLRVISRGPPVLIGWTDECPSALAEDPAFFDMTTGHVIAKCFSSSANEDFFRAWATSSPFPAKSR